MKNKIANKNPRVLMIGLTVPEEGGSERHIYEISSRMSNCTVLTQKGSLCKNKIEIPVIRKSLFLRNISFALMCYLYMFKLLLFKKEFDVIHIHENLLYFLAPILGIRYETVITVHGFQGFKFHDRKYLWFFFKWALLRADKIITHGFYETQLLKKLHNDVNNIPDGVDLDIYKRITPKIEKKISFVGRVHEQKGIIYLLDAFEIVSRRFPDYKFEIIAKKNDFQRELARKHTNKRIIWRGFILDRRQLFKEIASSEILIYPSLWEAVPWPALLEGLASGRPVIASVIYGLDRYFKNNKEILFVKPKNSNEIANSVIKLIKNKKLASKIGKNAKKTLEGYGLDVAARKIYNYYSS
ncbi:glycosyltransferase family 4 protein [Candidatus Pacearchaeota archaeon]|nr:glycosyltransferase family 4 protein [Candidatus Pacearchaeota archaeon]